jgi:putative endonuclease
MTPWTVYILRCVDGSLYTGVATDVGARVAKHNAGKGAKYTRGRRPVELVYREAAASRGAAQQREHAIKRLPRVAKQRLIAARRRGSARAARRLRRGA